MKKTASKNIRNIIADVVASNISDSPIIAVYLFGSRVRGAQKGGADVDIAFLLDEKAYRSDPVQAVSPAYLAAARIGLALDCETDVTILNAASLEMAYEIITTGVCLMDLNDEKRMIYEITLKGMYFDFRPFLDEIRSRCIEAL